MKWKRMMGISNKYSCYKCGSSYSKDEFSLDDDVCIFCLFPEAPRSRPVEGSYTEGTFKNVTDSKKLLDDLEYIPEKQSKQSIAAFKKFKNRNIYK